jgi:hypothetical protein
MNHSQYRDFDEDRGRARPELLEALQSAVTDNSARAGNQDTSILMCRRIIVEVDPEKNAASPLDSDIRFRKHRCAS